jgi:N-acyl-D-aspartate/D-glutamate deacylase
MFDLLIRGASVIDGTGAPAIAADVGVRGDRVAAVGDLSAASAAQTLDAGGLVLAPGFIDIHTHSDFTLLVDGRADSAVCQGVTTEVVGQCGFSAAPMGSAPDAGQMLGHIAEAGIALDWRRFGDYLDRLEAARPAVNVAAFVGHGALWRAAHDTAIRRAAGDGTLASMQALAEQAFDDGAFGLSTGLEYWPGNEAPAEEIDAMAAVAARRGRLYATHVRNRDIDCTASFAEAIRSARTSGARLQISHIQPKFGAPPHAMASALEQLDAAEREHGVDAAFDVIPHEWSHTVVVSCLPAWAREGGTAATLARLADPAIRARMKHNPQPIWRLASEGHWERIVLLRSLAHPEWVGQPIATLARLLGHADGFDAVFDLLRDEGEQMPQLMWTARNFDDADICLCLRDRRCSVMSDALTVSARGPLQGVIGSLGGYGWTARLLGGYARERDVLTLAEAVHRISGRPAARLGLTDRGVLREGAFADLVVFDAQGVRDETSIAAPATHPGGFVHVFVNGRAVVRDGQRNDECPGRVLRAG